MAQHPHFAANYTDARTKFMAACAAAGCLVTSCRNPNAGPDGEILCTDYTSLGEESAEKILIVNSAIHGVEGFCGSAAQIAWLRTGRYREIPDGMKVVLIHALNPYGFAWLRRVNEDNVDLNRNFIDFDSPLPASAEYERFHQVFLPAHWNQSTVGEIEQALSDYAERHGLLRMQAATCRGQYRYPDGVFFGGSSTTWSNRVFKKIVKEHIGRATRVMLLDFHTGLGSYGAPELICARPPDDGLLEWFSDKVTCARLGNAVGPSLSGTIGQGLRQTAAQADIYSITAEFGTYDVHRVLLAIIADNWAHARGGAGHSIHQNIQREIRESFYPDQDDWREAITAGSRRVLDQAIGGLASL